MEFKGRIYKVLETTHGTSRDNKEWQKQEFIFEFFEHETDRYSDKVVLSIMNDRIKEYDLHEGDELIIGFGHNVREYQGRWFNDLRAYKIEKAARMPLFEEQKTALDSAGTAAQPSGETQGTVADAKGTVADDEDDGLPF